MSTHPDPLPVTDDQIVRPDGDPFSARSASSDALSVPHEWFRSLVENVSDLITILDATGVIRYKSPAARRLLGYEPSDLVGQDVFGLIHPDDQSQTREHFARVVVTPGEAFPPYEMRLRHHDGSWRVFEASLTNLLGDPLVAGIVSSARDITQRKIREAVLQHEADTQRASEEKYRNLFENTTEGIYQTAPDGRVLSANPALARICGYESPEAMRDSADFYASPVYADPARRAEFLRLMEGGGLVSTFESRILRRDGTVIWIRENARAVRDARTGDLLYFEGTVSDISERKIVEDQLLYDAFHDALTGLPNRALFLERLEHRLDRNRHDRAAGDTFAVLFLDLDRFKTVNDSLGHLRGDELLVAVGQRIATTARPDDTVARLGGDEFVVLLEDIAPGPGAADAASRAAEQLQAALARPFPIGYREVFLSASIGIALSLPAYERPEDLLHDADMAMYRAKKEGRARHALFDQKMHERAVARLELETDLRRALERGEMRVFYQPIVSLTTGRIAGLEALARWQHAGRGLVTPDAFIPEAEETGLIVPIGSWILAEACGQMRAWQARFPDYAPHLSVSVNLSPRQMGTSVPLLSAVDAVLENCGLPAQDLHLEVTETSLMEANGAASMLSDLAARGIHIVLDDFGTGYSSLSYLHRFPITHIKIDRSFVQELSSRGEEAAIVRAIITMAQSLNIAVVAEGIETPEPLSTLRDMGCDFGQGYLFSPPLAVLETEALLARAPVW